MKELITRVEFTVLDKLLVADPCYIDKDDAQVRIDTAIIDGLGLLLNNCAGEWVAEVKHGAASGRIMELTSTRRGSWTIPLIPS